MASSQCGLNHHKPRRSASGLFKPRFSRAVHPLCFCLKGPRGDDGPVGQKGAPGANVSIKPKKMLVSSLLVLHAKWILWL